MRKKILGLLLALCLIVGLLPVTALADATDGKALLKFGWTKLELTGYDTPIYYKNGSVEKVDTKGNKFTCIQPVLGDADNWNAKFEWKSGDAAPTLTLDGFIFDEYNNEKKAMMATYDTENEEWTTGPRYTYAITTPTDIPCNIVLTGKDSLIECYFGVTYYGDLDVKSVGDTKLVMNCQASGFSAGKDGWGHTLTMNANIDSHIRAYYGSYFTHNLRTYGADLTINGGTYNLTSEATQAVMAICATGEGSDVIINGGTFNCNSSVGEALPNGVIDAAGKVTINGGDFVLKPKEAVGISGATGVEINGGNIKIETPHYGITAGDDSHEGDVAINGGTVEIYSSKTGKELEGGAFLVAPILGSKITGVAGTSADTAVAYNESLMNTNYVKLSDSAVTPGTTAPTQGATQAPTQGATQAPTQGATQAPTQGATQAPTQGATQAPTQGATQAPTQGATQGATQAPAQTENNNNPGTGDNGIVMFSALLLVAVFGIVATVAFGKKNSIAE